MTGHNLFCYGAACVIRGAANRINITGAGAGCAFSSNPGMKWDYPACTAGGGGSRFGLLDYSKHEHTTTRHRLCTSSSQIELGLPDCRICPCRIWRAGRSTSDY